jgi:hypothetical protein
MSIFVTFIDHSTLHLLRNHQRSDLLYLQEWHEVYIMNPLPSFLELELNSESGEPTLLSRIERFAAIAHVLMLSRMVISATS